MDNRLLAHRRAVAADVRSLTLAAGLTSEALESEIEDIIWISYAQRAFDSWFEHAYYWAAQRRWARRDADNWARVPLALMDQVYDWPVRRMRGFDYAPNMNKWRVALDLSNAFHVWQRARRLQRQQRHWQQELLQLVLIPLTRRHGCPAEMILVLMHALGVEDTRRVGRIDTNA